MAIYNDDALPHNEFANDLKTDTHGEFSTKDLGEAAAILCESGTLLRLEREQDFFWFIFLDKKTCEQLSTSYWNGQLQVSAKAYSNALKELKDRLFSRR